MPVNLSKKTQTFFLLKGVLTGPKIIGFFGK